MVSPRPGSKLGPYLVTRALGAGASGQVLEAIEEGLERRVAIKLLSAGARASHAQLERFRREREALARIDHPHVLRVHSAGSWQGIPYVVTELLPGRTLRQLLGEAALPVAEALALTRQAAEGLGALHAAGLLHRDIKPENLLIDARGQVKVADLGLAVGEGDDQLTRTGSLLGTPDYMAPEGLRGELLRAPTVDVYSLGLVLFELLTARQAHDSPSLPALIRARCMDPPVDPRGLRPDLPAPVAAVCLRALALDPAQRYPDGAAFAQALAGLERGDLASPARAPVWAALGLLVLAAGLVWVLFAAEPLPAAAPAPAPPAAASGPAPEPRDWTARVAQELEQGPPQPPSADWPERAAQLLADGRAADAAQLLWTAARGPARAPEAALRLLRLLGRGGRDLPADPGAARALLLGLLAGEPRLAPARLEAQWVWTGPGGLGRALTALRARARSAALTTPAGDGLDPAAQVLGRVARYEGWTGQPPAPEVAVGQLEAAAHDPDPDLAWLAARWLDHAHALGDPAIATRTVQLEDLDPRDLLGFDGSQALRAVRDAEQVMLRKGPHDRAMGLPEGRTRQRGLEPLARAGFAGSQFELAQLLWRGWGVPCDQRAAQAWYAAAALDGPQASMSGASMAWVWLGSALWAGGDGVHDRQRGLECLRFGQARIEAAGALEMRLRDSELLVAQVLLLCAQLEDGTAATRPASWGELSELLAANPAETWISGPKFPLWDLVSLREHPWAMLILGAFAGFRDTAEERAGLLARAAALGVRLDQVVGPDTGARPR